MFKPNLQHFQYGNRWGAEIGNARFMLTPDAEKKDQEGKEPVRQLTAQVWRGPFGYELAEIRNTCRFPLDQDGIESAFAWVEAEAEAINREPPLPYEEMVAEFRRLKQR
ncbi:MAG: hypothetical protein LKK00_08555 [Intestinimonas sp.]|nr:hypothetical protein [Intestinimonas sp.]